MPTCVCWQECQHGTQECVRHVLAIAPVYGRLRFRAEPEPVGRQPMAVEFGPLMA